MNLQVMWISKFIDIDTYKPVIDLNSYIPEII